MNKNLTTMLSELRKTTNSTAFIDSDLASIPYYIDTGSYALNRIISGDFYNGIPAGRIIVIGGAESSGKSLIAANCAANAIKDDMDMVFWFDSEGGAMKNMFINTGCDLNKVEHIIIDSVEDCMVKLLKTYKLIETLKQDNPNLKFMCVLDSLGALVSKKMINDIVDKESPKSDMGGRAKLVNTMVKACTIPALKTKTSLIIINHIYDDPSSIVTKKIKTQGGGRGTQYMGQIMLQCSKTLGRDSDDAQGFYNTTKLKFFTVKNRIVRAFLDAEVELDFSKGITSKYSGLLDLAVEYGYIEKLSTQSYGVKNYVDKKGNPIKIKRKNIYDPKIWEEFIDDFNAKSKKLIEYSALNSEYYDDETISK